MQYVNGISIEHYKCFNSLSVSGFTPVTLITGPNGSGKTSLCEAIEILMNPFDFNHYVNVTETHQNGFWNSFDKRQGRCYTKIEGKIINQTYFTEIASYFPPFSESFQGVHHFGYPKNKELIIESKQINTIISNSVRENSSKPLVHYRKISPNHNALSFVPIAKDQFLSDKVLSYLSLFDSDYVGFQTENFQDTVLYHKKYQTLRADFFSDGMRNLLQIAEKLSNFSHGVVFLDSLDYQISPNAFSFLVELLYQVASKRQLQLFITTHSLELIDEWLDLLHFYRQLPEISLIKLRSQPDKCVVKQYSGELMYQLRMEQQTDFRISDPE